MLDSSKITWLGCPMVLISFKITMDKKDVLLINSIHDQLRHRRSNIQVSSLELNSF